MREKLKFTTKRIVDLKKICKESTQVVAWYPHKFDSSTGGSATVRGPWNRWVTIHKGIDPKSHGNQDNCGVAEPQDDAEFIAAAMNYFPTLLNEYEKQKQLIKKLKKEKSDLKFKLHLSKAGL